MLKLNGSPTANALDGIVWLAEVKKVVPVPVCHVEQFLHAAEQHCEQASSAPDRRKASRRHANVGQFARNGGQLTIQVVLPLQYLTPETGFADYSSPETGIADYSSPETDIVDYPSCL